MRVSLCALLLVLPAWMPAAEKSAPVTIEALVDEAIQRPGDGSQICDAPEPVPYSRPPIPVYGLSVAQSTFLSEPMKKLLHARREEVVQELGKRLEKLDLLNPPPAPAKLKKPILPPLYPPAKPDEVDFETETKQNPRSVGGVALTIILELDAAELLPQLLKLEEQLHGITEAALKNDKAKVPAIETGGYMGWEGQGEEFKDIEDWNKMPPRLKRKQQIFDCLVFDRELLGMMAELVRRKGYQPLAASTLGRIRTLKLQHRDRDEDLQKIASEKDIPEDQKDQMGFDKDAGVPYWRSQIVRAPYTEALRQETRGLVEAFLKKESPPVLTGAQILDQVIANPGDYSQMCGMPSPIPFDAPLPLYGPLAPRHYSLSSQSITLLQAYRAEIVPVLLERLKAIDFAQTGAATLDIVPVQQGQLRIIDPSQPATATPDKVGPSGTDPKALSGLLLEVIQVLQAVECLPELLRLEEQLATLLTAADKAAAAPLTAFNLDSPIMWEQPKVQAAAGKDKAKNLAERERKQQIFTSRIFQREILGLIGGLLRKEGYGPLYSSSVEKVYVEGLKKNAAKGELKELKAAEDIPWESRHWIVWDAGLNIPVYAHGSVVRMPYTAEARAELRKLAQDFLASVPAEQRRGAKAMRVNAE